MRQVLCIAVSLVLYGCGLSNREIVEKTEYCHAHGMDVLVYKLGGDSYTTGIECDPHTKWPNVTEPQQ